MNIAKIHVWKVPVLLYGDLADRVLIYIHGQGGRKEEAESFAEIATNYGWQVISVDLPEHGERKDKARFVPWEIIPELQKIMKSAKENWKVIGIYACSIGAYFSIQAFQNTKPDICLLVSPVLDMEDMISNMMLQAQVTEEQLKERQEIKTETGVVLSCNEKCTKQQMLDVQALVDAQGLECRVWRNQNTEVEYARFSVEELPDDPSKLYLTGYEKEAAKVRSYDTYTIGEEDKGVVGIADGALKGDQTITYFAVPHNDEFVYVGKEAFADSIVEHVDLFDSVTSIGAEAFRNCAQLKEITIPASVTEIGENAFAGCSGLTSVNILCDVGLLPEGAFADCANLTEATVAAGSIPARLFEGSALASLNMGEGVTEIGSRAFAGTSLSEFVIPANIPVNGEALEGIELSNIRLSADATDEQVAEWSAALNYPWYDRICRVGEESMLVKMPYEPLPEDNFEFDEESRTITAYVGTAVDVIIPRTIGGVPVENISYNAFENTRDYVHSDMETNQKEGDWVPMRCVILPETLKSIEDSAFTNCHDLETVICYAPLETTNNGLFSECQGLKKVVFVNGVLHMDNYLFNFCKNLETVWCKNQVDRIGIQTFGVTPMERLCVNAKNIDISAFAGMESLKEIHIRGGVEHMSLGAFAMLPSIETICLEGIDPDVMEDDWANLGNSNLTILVPEDTSDEQLEAIGRKFLSSMIITDGAQVKRGTCSMPEDPKPDIAEMLSAYGI